MSRQFCVHETVSIIFHCSLAFFFKNVESIFDTVLGKDGIICDDVGWWSGFNKVSNIINNVGIGFCNTMNFIGTNE